MTNRTNENWLRGNEEQEDNNQLSSPKPSVEAVDRLADELVAEYDNEPYRAYYCRAIYDFGIDRVRYWQQKARNGDTPGALFGYYVRQARRSHLAHADITPINGQDTVHPVRGDETNDELLDNMRKTLGEDLA